MKNTSSHFLLLQINYLNLITKLILFGARTPIQKSLQKHFCKNSKSA